MRAVVAGLVVGLGVLAGCSDGGGSEDERADGPPPLGEPQSLDAMIEQADEIDTEIDLLDYSDPAELPTSGEAVYEGVMGIGDGLEPEDRGTTVVPAYLVGQLAMGVDFSDGEVDGQAGNFRTSQNEAYDGTLAIDGGEINRDINPDGGGWTYEADMAGTLTNGDDEVEVEADFLGDFFGVDHSHAQGIIDNGEIRGSDGTSFALDGRFVAER